MATCTTAGPSQLAGDSAGAGFDSSGRIVIRNASLVLTMDPKLGEGPIGRLEDADVLIDRDRIAAVGKNLPAGDARVHDGHDKIVLPGFVEDSELCGPDDRRRTGRAGRA